MCVTRAVRVQNLQNQHQTRKSRVVHWFIASSSIKTIRGDTLVRELHRYDIFRIVERAWTRDDGFFHAAMREALRLEPLPEHAVALKYLKLARDLMTLEKNTAAGETVRTREIMEREAQDAVARAVHEQ